MDGVDVPRGAAAEVVRSPAAALLVVGAATAAAAVPHVVDVVAVCADAERAPIASTAVRLADRVSPRRMFLGCMVLLLNSNVVSSIAVPDRPSRRRAGIAFGEDFRVLE